MVVSICFLHLHRFSAMAHLPQWLPSHRGRLQCTPGRWLKTSTSSGFTHGVNECKWYELVYIFHKVWMSWIFLTWFLIHILLVFYGSSWHNCGIMASFWWCSRSESDTTNNSPSWASRAVMESRNCSWPWPFPVDESIHLESQQFESMVPSLHHSSPVSIPIGLMNCCPSVFPKHFFHQILDVFPIKSLTMQWWHCVSSVSILWRPLPNMSKPPAHQKNTSRPNGP